MQGLGCSVSLFGFLWVLLFLGSFSQTNRVLGQALWCLELVILLSHYISVETQMGFFG